MTEHPSPVTFQAFVASLAATTAATLEHVRGLLAPTDGTAAEQVENREEQIRTGLETAKQLVDTMAMLEQKTLGNLAPDEKRLLQAVLTEGRITYVKVRELAAKQT